MDCVDSEIVLSPSYERCGNQEWIESVPAFSAVYHGGVAVFGNYALIDGIPPWDPLWPAREKWKNERDWHAECPDQFALELARTVAWGMQPTVCNLTMEHIRDARFADDYQWIISLARFYHAHREFLYDGVMLSPDGFECAEHEVRFLQRGLFTTEDKLNIQRRMRPVILHSVWQAPDGRKALVMLNYTRSSQTASYSGQNYTLPPRTAHCIEF